MCNKDFRELVINSRNLAGPEYFAIEIERAKVRELLQVFGQDYQHMANHLKLMNDRMVLVNPKYTPGQEEQ